jgi:hypothetical protein
VQHRAFESTGQNPSRDADGSCHPDLGESTFGSTSRPDCINWVSCKYLSSSQSHRDTFMAFVCKLGMMYLALFCTVIIEFTSWSIIYTYIYMCIIDLQAFVAQLDSLIYPSKIYPIQGDFTKPIQYGIVFRRCG